MAPRKQTAMEKAALVAASKPLTGKRLDLLNVLLEGRGIKQAAAEVGVTADEAIHWTQDVGFRSLMLTRLRANLDVYVVRAMLAAPEALASLMKLALSPAPDGATVTEQIMHNETKRRAAQVVCEAFMGVVAMTPEFQPRAPEQSHKPMFALPSGARVAVFVDGRDLMGSNDRGNGGGNGGDKPVAWVEQGAPPEAAVAVAPVLDARAVDVAELDHSARPAAPPAAPTPEAVPVVTTVVVARAASNVTPETVVRAGSETKPVTETRAGTETTPDEETRAEPVVEPEKPVRPAWELASPDVTVPGLAEDGTMEG